MTRISKPPQERKKEILDTALELFLKNGYENTSVGDIVSKLGVAQGLFYYYFKSKDEVYRAAMEQYTDDFAAQLASIVLEPTTLIDKIEKILKIMSDMIAESEHANMDGFRLAEHIDMDNRLSLHVAQTLIEPVTNMLEEMNNKGIIKIENTAATAIFLVYGIFGLLHGNQEHLQSIIVFDPKGVVLLASRVLGVTREELMQI
jgi:AcrR family transcriptional regulator